MIAIEVIEHLFIPKELLVYAQKHLPINGHLVISTPYHGYLKNLAISIFDLWDQHHHPLKDGGRIAILVQKNDQSAANPKWIPNQKNNRGW